MDSEEIMQVSWKGEAGEGGEGRHEVQSVAAGV